MKIYDYPINCYNGIIPNRRWIHSVASSNIQWSKSKQIGQESMLEIWETLSFLQSMNRALLCSSLKQRHLFQGSHACPLVAIQSEEKTWLLQRATDIHDPDWRGQLFKLNLMKCPIWLLNLSKFGDYISGIKFISVSYGINIR